jgi:hypothetical protein
MNMESLTGQAKYRSGLMIVVFVLCIVLSVTCIAFSQPGWIKAAGAGASFLGPNGWYDSDISVEIVRPQNSVWLRYLITDGNIQFNGQGYIPTESLLIFGQSGSAFLDVDTTSLSGFNGFRCVTNPDSSYECTPHPGGVIRFEWSGNGEYREETLLQRRGFYGNQNGPSMQKDITWMTTANARGVALGNELETTSASVSNYTEQLR